MRICPFRNGFGLALVACSLIPRIVSAAGLPEPNPYASADFSARQISTIIEDLFGTGQFSAALHQANAALEIDPNNAQLLCLKGDILFRESRFSEAALAYEAALAAESSVFHQARAHWGLGRLAVASSRPTKAREHFAAAFRLNPRDPDIVLAYAESAPDPQQHVGLLRRFLQLSRPSDSRRREEVAANLKLAEQLGSRQLSRVVNANQLYQFKLSDFSSTQADLKGLRVDVRINGSGPFRMLLDSGAEGVFLNSRAARKLKLEPVVEARILGLGEQEARSSQDPAGLMLASSLALQDRHARHELQIENLLVTVMDLGWLPEIDGVIGTDVFKDFLVRIDAQSKMLELLPYGDGAPVDPAAAGVAPMYRFGHRLLVRGSGMTNDGGYFMLDTGASFTVLSAPHSASSAASKTGEISLRGAQGYVGGAMPAVPVRIAIAEQQWLDAHPVSVDLTSMSQDAGVEISGILGFPLLRQSVLTINYRDGLVAFAANRH